LVDFSGIAVKVATTTTRDFEGKFYVLFKSFADYHSLTDGHVFAAFLSGPRQSHSAGSAGAHDEDARRD
jgi:hypothetical protein